ncbi:MAG TPA: DUF115 domain-containing protein [Defluviitaleaceae bacterium]|nr:DUF115 domain-containing protein [Defluviitaleaceae bacterium]HPT76582.1 DUF115 domain-containing protein [Defluviitaleaceae bacterium]
MIHYEKNILLLKQKDLLLYNKMNLYQSDKEKYIPVMTTSGDMTLKVISYDYTRQKQIDFFLHSKYNPIKEAEKFAKAKYNSNKGIILYGFALGYHIEALMELLSDEQELYIFEMNLDVFKSALEIRDLSKILSHPGLHFIITDNTSDFALKLSRLLEEHKNLIIYPPSLKTIPEEGGNIRFILEDWDIKKTESNEWKERVIYNYERNKRLNCPNVGELFGKYKDLPFVVVSAGPSLEKNVHLLKKLEGRAFIFAVGRVLKILLWKDIEPDMFCIIDPQYGPTYSQIEGYEDLDIPLVFHEYAAADTIAKYRGPKYIASDKKEHIENPGHLMELGGSVATAVVDLAIRFGGNPIVFVGQDLAFTNGQSHAYGGLVNQDVSRRKVKGQNGEFLDTTLGLLSFKHWIENKIRDNPRVEFINATEGGAYIEGCKHMSLQDFIDQYIDFSSPIDKRLRQRKLEEEIKLFTASIEYI